MKQNHQFFKDISNFPNKLCLFRMVLILISVTCFMCGLPIIASLVGLIGGITDKIDGIYARKHNMCTQLGSLLDQVSDLLFNFFAIASAVAMGVWPIWVLYLWGFRDISILCVRTSAGQLGFKIPSSPLGRVATFEMFCALFFMPLDWALNSSDYMYHQFVVDHIHPWICIGMHWFALLAILVGIGMQYVAAAKYVKFYVGKYDEIMRPKDASGDAEPEKSAEMSEDTSDASSPDVQA